MRTAWCRWVILMAVSALLFSLLAVPAAFGAVLLEASGPAAQAEEEAEAPEENGELPEEEEAEEPEGEEGETEEPRSPEEVLEEVLKRIDAVIQKCLDALNRAMEEAAEEAREALELAISNVERVREKFASRGLPPFGEGPLSDRPWPGDRGGEDGDEGAEGYAPDVEKPQTPQPPVMDELPAELPVPWAGGEFPPSPKGSGRP